MILIRRLFHEAERSNRGEVLCQRWLHVLWSKGIVGIQLGPWRAGETSDEPEIRRGPLSLFGESRLRDEELELLSLLAATQHRSLLLTRRLAELCRAHGKSRRHARLQGDLSVLLGKLERLQPVSSSERFDDQVADVLRRALRRTHGKVYGDDGAAKLLGLKPTTLQSKLKKYGIK